MAAPPPIRTHVAHAEWGTNRFVGHDVRTQLLGTEGYVGLLFLALSGRRPEQDERALLDDMAVAMTVADPRIWPLKLGRLVSSYGGCLAAVAAINLSLEGGYIGHWTSAHAAELLSDAGNELGEDVTDAARIEDWMRRRFEGKRRLFGFGVPFRSTDERVEMLARCVEARGRAHLRWWRVFECVASAARAVKGLEPNIGLAVAGACLDLGLEPQQVPVLVAALGQNDFWANAIEGAEQRAPSLQELPSACVEYVGAGPRRSPRSLRAG